MRVFVYVCFKFETSSGTNHLKSTKETWSWAKFPQNQSSRYSKLSCQYLFKTDPFHLLEESCIYISVINLILWIRHTYCERLLVNIWSRFVTIKFSDQKILEGSDERTHDYTSLQWLNDLFYNAQFGCVGRTRI